MPEIEIRAFDELSTDELYAILQLRCEVFVVGQGITSEPDVDGADPECVHAMMWEGDQLVGTARIEVAESPWSVGRVAVAESHRGQGLGTELMEAVHTYIGDRPVELHAQAHLEEWYRSLGWERVGAPFFEANIEHVRMVWR
jgi:ElaA protein